MADGIPNGMKPAMAEAFVGLHIIAFTPLVPCLQEKNLVFGLLATHQPDGLLHCALELLRRGIGEDIGLAACTGCAVPLGKKRRIHVLPGIFLHIIMFHYPGIICVVARGQEGVLGDIVPQHAQLAMAHALCPEQARRHHGIKAFGKEVPVNAGSLTCVPQRQLAVGHTPGV